MSSHLATATFDPHHPAVQRFLTQVNTGWKMWFYYLVKLPTLAWWGVSVRSCTPEGAVVAIPYGWRTQNPFRSTYFAALAGAAELSTGLLALTATQGRGPFSTLITQVQADYSKKATSTVTFICEEGARLIEAADLALVTGEPQVVTATTVGRQADGTEVARLRFTWSFKVKVS